MPIKVGRLPHTGKAAQKLELPEFAALTMDEAKLAAVVAAVYTMFSNSVADGPVACIRKKPVEGIIMECCGSQTSAAIMYWVLICTHLCQSAAGIARRGVGAACHCHDNI